MNRYLSNLDINYSWPSGLYDLNTKIEFVNEFVGVGTGISGVYSFFSGNNTGSGPETYFIDLFSAENNNLIPERALIRCYADWSLSGSGSGFALLTYNYNGKDYTEYISPNISSSPNTLVKTIEIKIGEIGSLYNNDKIYEFSPALYLNTENLSETATGFVVHKEKDVKFIFNISDRQNNVLTSTPSIAESPFVKSVNIDILDIYGNIVADNYVSNSYANNFILSEQENINIFGSYQENFGIGLQIIGADTNIHTNEYYVYGNKLQIKKISVNDSNGYWINETSLNDQIYNPSSLYETNAFFENVTNSALYWDQYKITNNLYEVNLSGVIPFAVLTGESLKIDWGYTGGIETIFKQTGLTNSGALFSISGISAVSCVDTNTGDFKLSGAIYPNQINGMTYTFSTGYNYPSGITGIYNATIYYSGIGSTGNELIKTIQYRIPDELKPQGKPQIGDKLTGKINIDIELLNDPFYTNFDKFELYINQISGASLLNSSLIKTIPILTNTNKYSFSLDRSAIQNNTDYWFTIAPYSSIGKGYDWTIGPYNLYTEKPNKSNLNTESITLFNGDDTTNIDFITGSIINNQITNIDSIDKNFHKTHDYLCQFQDSSGCFCSSRVLIVNNSSGLDLSRTGVSFSQYGISDNSFVNLSVQEDSTTIYLQAQIDNPTGLYKLYKTSI